MPRQESVFVDSRFRAAGARIPGLEGSASRQGYDQIRESVPKGVARLGVGNQVDIVGFTNDLAGEYSRAAFIAFPSRLEGFPLAILEAAKYALPTLATSNLPGVTDIVRSDETGLVVPRTVPAFAAGLRKLMTDVAYREALGLVSRDYCAAHYSRARILDRWESLLSACR